MKLYKRALCAWHWNRLSRERKALSQLTSHNSPKDPTVIARSRRMDRRCAILLRLERELAVRA